MFFSRDDAVEENDESGDESGEEISKKRESPPVAENNEADESRIQLVDHNWSFLATILPDREDIAH